MRYTPNFTEDAAPSDKKPRFNWSEDILAARLAGAPEALTVATATGPEQ